MLNLNLKCQNIVLTLLACLKFVNSSCHQVFMFVYLVMKNFVLSNGFKFIYCIANRIVALMMKSDYWLSLIGLVFIISCIYIDNCLGSSTVTYLFKLIVFFGLIMLFTGCFVKLLSPKSSGQPIETGINTTLAVVRHMFYPNSVLNENNFSIAPTLQRLAILMLLTLTKSYTLSLHYYLVTALMLVVVGLIIIASFVLVGTANLCNLLFSGTKLDEDTNTGTGTDISLDSTSTSSVSNNPSPNDLKPEDDDKDQTPGALQGNPKQSADTYKELAQQAFESDEGSTTDNPYILAKRYAASGNEPTADMINEVQLRKGSNRVTSKQVTMFKYAWDNCTKIVTMPLLQKGLDILRSMNPINNKTPGCYVITHKPSGDFGVGSSITLANRLRKHFNPDFTNKAEIAKHIKNNNKNDYLVQVVRLPLDLPQTQSALLAFEQYLFLRLNPNINKFFVAGSSMMSQEALDALRKSQGTPVFVYYDNVLVAKAFSVRDAATKLNISRTNIKAIIKQPSNYLTHFKLTTKQVPGAKEDLMDQKSLNALFDKYRGDFIHLYIGGNYINTYDNISKLCEVTGLTTNQVSNALHRVKGYLNKNSDILFTRSLIEDSPEKVISNQVLLDYCKSEIKKGSRYNIVYVYHNGTLVHEFSSMKKAIDAIPNNNNSYPYKTTSNKLLRGPEQVRNFIYSYNRLPETQVNLVDLNTLKAMFHTK